ncbi:hypothetical protein GTW25_17475 [Aliihoeflea aestuarii]|uniref:hypothetical protein n=1 Tax=Aliihoeflea aestuarii TaxID=453840 RepID=UPI0020955579|nr:hypothetical protein [Aliihoeflea aestuarii]MCO6392819.1 hypothetical protein [Aliihoeflea aestuarii]
MTLTRDELPRSILASMREMWRRRRTRQEERRALDIIAAKPHSHLLEDAGLTRDEIAHLTERRRLHGIADWNRWKGRGV